jgi:hypothetical protein
VQDVALRKQDLFQSVLPYKKLQSDLHLRGGYVGTILLVTQSGWVICWPPLAALVRPTRRLLLPVMKNQIQKSVVLKYSNLISYKQHCIAGAACDAASDPATPAPKLHFLTFPINMYKNFSRKENLVVEKIVPTLMFSFACF